MKGLLGRKLGMTQVFTEDGVLIGFKADKWKEFFNK